MKDIEKVLERSKTNGYREAKRHNSYIHIVLVIITLLTLALLVWHNEMAIDATTLITEQTATIGSCATEEFLRMIEKVDPDTNWLIPKE